MISEILERIKSYNPAADLSLVESAFKFAEKVHSGHKRLSGDPYITHPVAVAKILTELEQDPQVVASALLHDTIEDGGISREELATSFGEEIARLVEGVTKLGQLTFISKEERQAENFRKMFLAMGEDIRIIIIKLADRLHNMQTIKFLPEGKQRETSLETLEIFAPLAHRLGMWRLKWELEDLAFQVLEPASFADIKGKVSEGRPLREAYIATFMERVKEALEKVGIKGEIQGRPKHFYSIYRKMVDQNLEFDEIYDLIAVRIIVPTIRDCYTVLGTLHAAFKPIPGRFRDYIAMPKSNGYQSLHTTVIGEGGKPVEIQIRTPEMHRIAEYGIAAHWRYKEGIEDKTFDLKMSWLRQLLEWQKDLKDARDFMESLKIDLFVDEVFVFTPKGDVFALPIGATPIDFAYHVHTEVGHRCIGAKVNGKIAPLNHSLKNGDIVEVLTGKIDNPSLDWLNFVKTSAARTKIKSWFKRQKKEDNIGRGRELLKTEIRKMMLNPDEVLTPQNLSLIMTEHGLENLEDFYSMLGYGELSVFQVAKRARELWKKEHGAEKLEEEEVEPMLAKRRRVKKITSGIKVMELENVLIKLSRCCRPLPGDDIVGFITKGRGVAVHKSDCPNITGMEGREGRFVKVNWEGTQDIFYPVEIEVEAFDRVGVIKDILSQVAETKTNVSAANVKTKRGSSAIIKLVVDIKNTEHLAAVIGAIRSVSDVYDVGRSDIFKGKRIKKVV